MSVWARGQFFRPAYPKSKPKPFSNWPLRVELICSIYPRHIQVRQNFFPRFFLLTFFVELEKKTFFSLIFRTLAIASSRVEVELGKIIQKSGWKRTSYIITTKIYWSTKSEERGLSRKHIIESVKASLQRLQLPYIDIVIIYKADSMCPMEGEHRLFSFHIRIYCHVLLHNSKRRVMKFCDHRKSWALHSLKNCMHSICSMQMGISI